MTRFRFWWTQWVACLSFALLTHATALWARIVLEDLGAAGDLKLQYGASGAFTLGLASLGSSSDWTAGRESTALAVSALQPVLDVLIGGKITTGTSPTVNTVINIYVYAAVEDDPIYPDVFDGTDSAETVTSVNVRNSAIKFAHAIMVDATSDRTYWWGPISVAKLFGGVLPTHFGLFVAHNTAVALNATGSNHAAYYTPVYSNVAQS